VIPLLLLLAPARAVDREAVLDHAADFTTHAWTMGSGNQYASCDSSYISDWSPGATYRGLPYDWGGWVSTAQYDSELAAGYGAGSHSWNGVLSCTAGVDCSGFVSQTWETSKKYGTSTFYQVTSDISASALKRGDALNNAGSHIVLFAYETDAGLPVYYESAGTLVSVVSDNGWSHFSSYQPVRYDSITDGTSRGTASNPIEIRSFPYEDLRWTAGAASDAIDAYSCAPDLDESGPEQLYRFDVATAGTLDLRVSDDDGVDVDIHVLTAPDGDACLDRDDSELSIWLEPGEYWIAADTWVGSTEYAGPYLLTASFTGSLGEPDTSGGGATTGADTGAAGGGDTGGPGLTGGGGGGNGGGGGFAPGEPPGTRVSLVDGGGGCSSAPVGGPLWLLALVLVPRRRRRSA